MRVGRTVWHSQCNWEEVKPYTYMTTELGGEWDGMPFGGVRNEMLFSEWEMNVFLQVSSIGRRNATGEAMKSDEYMTTV